MLFQKNPFTMRGLLAHCWLFIYQTPAEAVAHLLPVPLKPVTHRGFAFWNIVVSQIRHMRPRGVPDYLGITYWHTAYRLYVRFHPASGEPIEGLYFLRSDCDSSLITLAGNLLTDFRFHQAAIDVREGATTVTIQVESPAAPAYAALRPEVPTERPSYSAFSSLEQAAAFLKYKPASITITHDGMANVMHIDRDEAAWRSKLVHIESASWDFLKGRPVLPEICYQVDPIAYQWNRGQLYR
jgi:uncharacterized protein YqjF (DUF2071 family)